MKGRVIRLGAIIFVVLIGLVLAGIFYQSLTDAKAVKEHPAPGKLVDVGGFRLHIHCTGVTGPTVVMDAGIGGTSLDWSLVGAEVSRFARVCVYDRAGYGWSDPAPGPRLAERAVDELHTLLVKANVPGPYILVGQSLGGLNARLFAARYPQEVAGLVLVDATHEDELTDRFPAYWVQGWAKQVSGNRLLAGMSRFGLLRMLAKAGKMPGVDLVAKLPAEVQAPILTFSTSQKQLKAMAMEMDALERSYAALRQHKSLGDLPLVVLVRGKEDRLPPNAPPGVAEELTQVWNEVQTELAAQSTRGQLVKAEKSGHNIHIEQPELVVNVIRELAERK